MTTAWVTLATNDGYATGAIVLAQSLRNVKTKHKLHILFTSGISMRLRQKLNELYDSSTEVNIFDSKDTDNLLLINRPDLGVTFTKLHCWRLTQYTKCVFLDADTLVLQNSDELFDHPEFSAASDIGWPDHFNSGVFVYVPSIETYHSILNFALSYGSFDGGDQGLLNKYFHDWRLKDADYRLSFLYNVTANAFYSYPAAKKWHAKDVKIIHFIGKQKPWNSIADEPCNNNVNFWNSTYFQVFDQHLSKLEPKKVKGYDAWDQGQPDFLGDDAFENIQKAIAKSLLLQD